MKILINSFGVRGDVQPYLALAVGLRAAGHHVTLATSRSFTEWIQAHGINAHPTRFDMQAFTQRPETQAILRSGNLLRQARLMRDMMRQLAAAHSEVWAPIQDAELVIQSPIGLGALEAAVTLGLPAVLTSPVPFAPTRAFPSFFMGPLRFSFGASYNRLTHALTHWMLWSALGGPLTNPLRRQLGLRPWRSFGEWLAHGRRLGVPMLYGFSRHVLPRPADWDRDQHITGYWFLEQAANWSPDTELLRYLDAGPPPVYIGFGSMTVGNAERRTRLARRALELSGQRGVLLTGWGGLARQTPAPNVHYVDDVPHAWLFPRMAAVVHHGGAGTTAAGMRAGVPSLLAPFAADQPAWAERVVQLGVGPRLPGNQQLTAEKLAEAIQQAVSDAPLRARAAALGEKIRAEAGVTRAIELIEDHAATFNQQAPGKGAADDS